MGLLQNGFRDTCGVFRTYGAGVSNGALPQQLPANFALTGMRRNLTAGEGITDDKVGLPLGYLVGGAYQLPQKPGFISARAYSIDLVGSATGTMGYPISGSALLQVPTVLGNILPEDDDSPLRTASATFSVTADATGEAKMSGTGSASFTVVAADADITGIFNGVGSSEISISINTPNLGAKADAIGVAMFSVSGMLIPYAIGNMVGNALPYTELSPQSLANAVWQAPASDNNAAGTMGNKLNTASSGGVDLDALAEAVWEYTP